jgi:hypothetical protein
MRRAMVLLCWCGVLLGGFLLVAAARPQVVDGGPAGVAVLPLALLAEPQPERAPIDGTPTLLAAVDRGARRGGRGRTQ